MTNPKASTSDTPVYDYHEHIIDEVLPAREVHLLAGPSGAGKTTFLMKLMENITKGGTIFGHRVHPAPFVYVSGDRGDADMMRTMERLHVDHKTFPLHIPTLGPATTVYDVIEKALKRYPDARIVVIEGLATMVPGEDSKQLIDYKKVAKFMHDLQRYCVKKNITIIGVVHSAKAKKDERYTSPRERILGSVAWGAFGNTIFYIEPDNAEDTANNPTRVLFILPRNGKDEFYKMSWKDGLLVPAQETSAPRRSNYTIFMEWFDKVEVGSDFTLAGAREATGLADSSCRFELKKALDVGLIQVYENRPSGTYIKRTNRLNNPGPNFKNAKPSETVQNDTPENTSSDEKKELIN